LSGIVPLANGGTNTSDPGWANTETRPSGLTKGAGISIEGTIFDAGNWYFTNLGVLSVGDGASNALTGDITLESTGGTVAITYPGTGNINLDVASGKFGLPIYYEGGGSIGGSKPHIVINDAPVSVSYSSGNTIATTTVTLTGAAQFPGVNYSVVASVAYTSGTPPIITLTTGNLMAGSFQISGYATGGSGSGTIFCNYIAVGD
jgi:hypothetical protein